MNISNLFIVSSATKKKIEDTIEYMNTHLTCQDKPWKPFEDCAPDNSHFVEFTNKPG